MPAIAGPGPSTLATQYTGIILVSRDNTDDNGGLAESTKIGIGLGLICFFGLIFSWRVILCWRRSRPLPTQEELDNQATFVRWLDRLAGAPAAQRARDQEDLERYQANIARRLSTSTVSTVTTNKGACRQETIELASPQKARLGRDRS